MSSPDLIDDRFQALVRELRAGGPRTPEALRARVTALPVPAPAPAPARRRLSLRRSALVLAPLCLAAVAAATVALDRGSSSEQVDRIGAAKTVPSVGAEAGPAGAHEEAQTGRALPQAAQSRASLPPSRARLQRYGVSMRLRVRNDARLSQATSRAMRIARGFGGYVVRVDYGTPQAGAGNASLTLRVPVGRVQEAIVRFSALGTILAQRIAIQDVQAGVNRTGERIASLRRTIATLESELERTDLDQGARSQLQVRLTDARRTLRDAIRARDAAVRGARLATISLELTTRAKAVAPAREPDRPGRLERAARHAGSLLLAASAAALYALILGGPLLLLVAAAVWLVRLARRRGERQLLERA